jgi:ATP-binding cassette, subfamily B, bacterial PglK
MNNYIKEIFYLLGKDSKKIPALVFLFVIAAIVDMVGIAMIGPYISYIFDLQGSIGPLDRVFTSMGLPSEKDSVIIIIGSILMIMFILKALSSIYINYKIVKFSQEQQVRLRSFLMQSYLSLPYEKYLSRNSSSYLNSIQDLVAQFSTGVVLSMLRVMSDGIIVFALIIILGITNIYALVLVAFLLGAFVFIYDRLLNYKIISYGTEANKEAEKLIQAVNESMEGLKEIRTLGVEECFYQRVNNASKRNAELNIIAQTISMIPRYCIEVILVAFVVALVIGTLFLKISLITLLPVLGVFSVAALRLMPSANMLSTSLINFRRSRDAISRLYNDLKSLEFIERKFVDRSAVSGSEKFFKSLEFIDVSFKYSGLKNYILNDISLKINSGDSIGLIGKSGAGKTTIVDLLLGLLVPSTGKIITNFSTSSKNHHDWQSQVAYLPQQVFIIDDTIRRNIAIGEEDHRIDDKRLNKALQQSFLIDFVNMLPQGHETILGERGVRLSGGQRQRIALARAFYYNKKILILDESTSALDNETEQVIIEEMKSLKGKITMVVIAHRLTTIKYCDRVYRIEDSHVVEVGKQDMALHI